MHSDVGRRITLKTRPLTVYHSSSISPSRTTCQLSRDFLREPGNAGYFPGTRNRRGSVAYHRLIQLPRGGPHRLIQPPRRGPHRLIQPPRRGPHRLIQTPPLTFGAETNQAAPITAAAIAAPDHFPMPLRNKRLSCNSTGSSEPLVRKDDSSFIAAQNEVLTTHWFPGP